MMYFCDNATVVGYFFEFICFVDVTEHVFDERMEYVQAVYLVASRNRKIEADQGHDVRLRYSQWRVQACNEV